MSDDDSHDDSLSSDERDNEQYDERAESVADRIDRINRKAFERIVCRSLVGHRDRVIR